VVDDAHITRDRKIFTKQVLRSFIKKTVTREAWTGAPWLVKHDVAAQYHIDTRVPPHLRYESKAAERKANQQQKKTTATAPDYDGMVGSFPGNTNGQGRLPELKPAPKSHKSKLHQGHAKSKQPPSLNPAPTFSIHQPPPLSTFHHPPPFVSHTFEAHGPLVPKGGPQFATFHPNGPFAFAPLASMPPVPPPPPPIKYPIDDLEVAPRHNGPKRPDLKYFSQEIPLDVSTLRKRPQGNDILMKSVGPLLECWDTLNVYCEIFKLDSFTLDDFAEAMKISTDDIECELFVEAHCAALKILVDSEPEGGKVQIQLPEIDDEDDEDDSEEEATPEPTPEPEPKPKRATRSSLAKAEAAALQAPPEPVKEPTPESTHHAAEMQAEMNWIDRLRKRDFKNGGWQIIIIGLLYQLSKNPRRTDACEELLKELAPLDMEPTLETARIQYSNLDVNLRIQALQIVCMLAAETKAARGYMEQCSEEMTVLRKEKIKWQRDKKI
jgi:hypothetical protein